MGREKERGSGAVPEEEEEDAEAEAEAEAEEDEGVEAEVEVVGAGAVMRELGRKARDLTGADSVPAGQSAATVAGGDGGATGALCRTADQDLDGEAGGVESVEAAAEPRWLTDARTEGG